MTGLYVRLWPALLAASVAPAWAEDGPPPQAACACTVVPALTPVSLEILAPLGSKISKSGDTFPIRLAAPIVIDGKEMVPAGATGGGEVVHAKKAGGSGAAGELVLAARYLEVDGKRLRLRSMNFSQVGQDKIGTVQTINIAAAATVPLASVIGFAISGKDREVPIGTVAQAKLAEPFVREAALPAAPEQASKQGE